MPENHDALSNEQKELIDQLIEKPLGEYESELYLDYRDEFNLLPRFEKAMETAKESDEYCQSEGKESMSLKEIKDLALSLIASSILEEGNVYEPWSDNIIKMSEHHDREFSKEEMIYMNEQISTRVGKAFDEFQTVLPDHGEKTFFSFGLSETAFNEGGSEITMQDYGSPETVNAQDEPFNQLLKTLKVTPKDFYDHLVDVKGVNPDSIEEREYFLNPNQWHDCFTTASELDLDQKNQVLEDLYIAMENQSSLSFEPCVIAYMSFSDYISIDPEQPIRLEGAHIALHDFICGSGYIMDNKLNVTLNEHGLEAVPVKYDGEYGYGIDEVYGLVTHCFEAEVKNIHPSTLAIPSPNYSLSL